MVRTFDYAYDYAYEYDPQEDVNIIPNFSAHNNLIAGTGQHAARGRQAHVLWTVIASKALVQDQCLRLVAGGQQCFGTCQRSVGQRALHRTVHWLGSLQSLGSLGCSDRAQCEGGFLERAISDVHLVAEKPAW